MEKTAALTRKICRPSYKAMALFMISSRAVIEHHVHNTAFGEQWPRFCAM